VNGLAISGEHRELAESARAVLADRDARGAARALLDATDPGLPAFWKDVVNLGWLGLHIAEVHGGQGFGLPELAIVVEQLGRVAAPGPFAATALALALVQECGTPQDQARLLPELLSGSTSAGVGLPGDLRWEAGAVSGSALVPGGLGAEVLLLPVGDDLVVLHPGPAVSLAPANGIDLTRRPVRITCAGAAPEAVLRGGARAAIILGRTLAAAEAAGGARACTEAAVAYAKERVQFGSPIGSFQAVKHMCANMLVAAELATAAAWDAARAVASGGPEAEFAAAVAADVALDAFVRCAELSIQVHGGIGFTWEHDAHLYLRRALALRAAAGGAATDAARLALDGVHRDAELDLPAEAETYRAEARAFLSFYEAAPQDKRRSLLARSGYAFPHWPAPYGRGAGPVEQLVIEQELTGVQRPELGIGTWILPTLLRHGTP